MSNFENSIVNAEWLKQNFKFVKCVDATWVLPGSESSLPKGFIPGSQFFDLDIIATQHSTLKHMLPSSEQFAKAVGEMGITETDHVICYDRHGVFSSPRLWWTFQMFGHEKISVLNGGLPAWIAAGGPISDKIEVPKPQTYSCQSAKGSVADLETVREALGGEVQIIDARPRGRFSGSSPEPRPNLSSGHMPGSLNIPFGDLRTSEGYIKSTSELEKIFKNIDISRQIITSCGSGITAAGLALALNVLGAKDVKLYDGSWADYAASEGSVIIRETAK